MFEYLRSEPLGRMPIPDAYQKMRAYDAIVGKPGEVIGEYVIREDNCSGDM